jgi:hypothetical protein
MRHVTISSRGIESKRILPQDHFQIPQTNPRRLGDLHVRRRRAAPKDRLSAPARTQRISQDSAHQPGLSASARTQRISQDSAHQPGLSAPARTASRPRRRSAKRRHLWPGGRHRTPQPTPLKPGAGVKVMLPRSPTLSIPKTADPTAKKTRMAVPANSARTLRTSSLGMAGHGRLGGAAEPHAETPRPGPGSTLLPSRTAVAASRARTSHTSFST